MQKAPRAPFFMAEYSELQIRQAPDLESRGLVGMAALERIDHGMDQLIGHHQLDLPLADLLNGADRPHKRLATFQRSELSLPQHLPAATVVLTMRPPPAANTAALTGST